MKAAQPHGNKIHHWLPKPCALSSTSLGGGGGKKGHAFSSARRAGFFICAGMDGLLGQPGLQYMEVHKTSFCM